MSQDKKNYKTTICRHFANKGFCSLYDKCHFAHGQRQLRKRFDPVPTQLPPLVKPVSIFKTQLCKYYMNGYCRNGLGCPFAHGPYDLHSIVVSPVETIKPDYGNAGQFLFSILRSLEQVFVQKNEMTILIDKGLQLVKENKLPQADEIITEIVKSVSLSTKQKQQCQTILQNAYALHKINFRPF